MCNAPLHAILFDHLPLLRVYPRPSSWRVQCQSQVIQYRSNFTTVQRCSLGSILQGLMQPWKGEDRCRSCQFRCTSVCPLRVLRSSTKRLTNHSSASPTIKRHVFTNSFHRITFHSGSRPKGRVKGDLYTSVLNARLKVSKDSMCGQCHFKSVLCFQESRQWASLQLCSPSISLR